MTEDRSPIFDYDNAPLSFSIRQYESWSNFHEILKRDLDGDKRSLENARLNGENEVEWELLVKSGEHQLAFAAAQIEEARKRIADHVGLNYVSKSAY